MEIILGDGTVITSEDVVFSYDFLDAEDPDITGSHDVWYDDICAYFNLTLKQAATKPEKWYDGVYYDKGFQAWVEEVIKQQYPAFRLVERKTK